MLKTVKSIAAKIKTKWVESPRKQFVALLGIILIGSAGLAGALTFYPVGNSTTGINHVKTTQAQYSPSYTVQISGVALNNSLTIGNTTYTDATIGSYYQFVNSSTNSTLFNMPNITGFQTGGWIEFQMNITNTGDTYLTFNNASQKLPHPLNQFVLNEALSRR